MINAPTHDLSYDKAKEARRYKNGDITNVRFSADWATLDRDGAWRWDNPISSHREALVHVRNWSEDNLKSLRLAEGMKAASDLLRMTLYTVVLPVANQAEVDADKQTTWTVPEGKHGTLDEIDIIHRKVLDPEFPDDPSKDTTAKSRNGNFR